MSRRAWAGRAIGAALVMVVAWGGLPGAVLAAAAPTVSPNKSSAPPGATVLVHLDGWQPGSVVTIMLCGNDALRGSQDCDLVSGESVAIRGAAPEYLLLNVSRPPMPCPCVVRASDVPGVVVATAPFVVIGAASASTVGPDSVAVPIPLSVDAQLHEDRGSFFDRIRRVLGGPSHRQLVLQVHNQSPAILTGVVVTAAVGRHGTGGAPLDSPAAFDLAVGETRTVTLPVTLEAPVHGQYVVSGRAFAGGLSSPFAVTVTANPWGLVVLALLVVVALAIAARVALRRGRQDRERRPPGGVGEHQVTDPPTLDEHRPLDPDPADLLS